MFKGLSTFFKPYKYFKRINIKYNKYVQFSNIKAKPSYGRSQFISLLFGCVSATSYLILFNSHKSYATSQYDELYNLYEEAKTSGREGDALFYLALLYTHGNKNFKKNYSKAIECFVKSYEMGVPEAALNLGIIYLDGQIVKKNIEKGIFYLQEADKMGLADATRNIGYLYYTGKLINKDLPKALHYFEKAANNQDHFSAYLCGLLYYTGKGGKRDIEKSIKYYTQAANNNIPEAQYELAIIYNSGHGVKEDREKSIQLFEMAAKNGHVQSQYDLYKFYDKNSKESKYWLEIASSNGHPKAQLKLGSIFMNEKKYDDAYELFTKCAESNIDGCRIQLANLILGNYELNHKKDPKLALEQLTIASNRSAEANFKLGSMYFYGIGVPKDLNKALHYFEIAADNGDHNAMFHMGALYLSGYGVHKSYTLAEDYFERSSALGNELAEYHLSEMRKLGLSEKTIEIKWDENIF